MRDVSDPAKPESSWAAMSGRPLFVADDLAKLYGLCKQSDQMFQSRQKAWKHRDRQLIQNLLTGPFSLPDQRDTRFADLCKQAGVPLPGEVLLQTRHPAIRHR